MAVSVRAALVTPLSGPLAGFGRATAMALRVWAERFSGADGVDLEVVDAHPDARMAVRSAERSRPDLLFGPYGSGPAAAVVSATSRLVWNHGGARLEPRPNVVNVLAPAASYFHGALRAVRRADRGARRVVLLHCATGFGRGVAAGAEQEAGRLGFVVERAVLPAEPPGGDVLLVVGRFDEEVAVARGLGQGGWSAVGFVGAGVEEVLAGLGAGREGLLGPAQWLPATAPRPDEGPGAREFVAAYRGLAGGEPPYPAAQAFAAGVVALRCLRDAGGADDGALAEAARALDCTTLFGRFRLSPESGQQVGHQVLTVQWQDGVRVVVWPPEQADAGLRYPLVG
ncbi:ABC transporter substrate-binding protein [Saccharopolyspora erythraea]|uniref:ABC transporter substrate-binding protein n=1 Tax=Saccharopolyspora erythraea TaxID=1836 RepID=UPI001BAE32EA|nr:ABC transporter substrate-binding protein [Saccharopolyspora erythraea]QUH02861.1 ABC transporter substrate-binding protein [Saccharopolyspora erythraea]